MTSRHVKRCSTLLIIREMQAKTTMSYHFIPVRTVIIKKSTNSKCWRGCGGKGILLHCWQECELIQLLWRIVWRFLKKLKIEVVYDPAISLLGTYLEKTMVQKDTCTSMFFAVLVTISKTWKQVKYPSTDKQMMKIWYMYTVGSYSAMNRIRQCLLQQHGWTQKLSH